MARPPQQIDRRLLSKVSKLYYEQNLTQQVIAERLHLSRPKVSRLLQQAVEEGIVQITVLSPPGVYAALEQTIEERYGLQEAVVVEVERGLSASAVSREVGIAAAEYLQRTLQEGDTIGISWGTTLNAMVSAMRGTEAADLHVIQIIGGLGPPESEIHATDLCRRLARLLNSRLTLIPAPGVVDSLQARDALLADSHVQAAFDLFPRLNVAYVGIGAPGPESLLRTHNSIVRPSEYDTLFRLGAVGDIALRFFDEQGQPVRSDLDERVIGISLEQLKHVERVVGVAGGMQKLNVVRAALNGGLIDVLITDQELAQHLLT